MKINPDGNCLGACVHAVGADSKYVRSVEGAQPERGEYKYRTYKQVNIKIRSYHEDSFLCVTLQCKNEFVLFSFPCYMFVSCVFLTCIFIVPVNVDACSFGAGLVSMGDKAQEAVAIYSVNRPEWTIANIGNFSQVFL